jgi:hypothetical protein
MIGLQAITPIASIGHYGKGMVVHHRNGAGSAPASATMKIVFW